MMQEQEKSHMSKKAAIAATGIAAIAASEDWKAQAFVSAVAISAIVVQGLLDWWKNKPVKEESRE